MGVIHLVLAHEGGGEVEQKRTPCVQREVGLTHLSTYAEKSLLSFFVIFGDDFHYYAKKHMLWLFSSRKILRNFFSLELLIIYLKTFPLKIGGGVRWVRVLCNGGVVASIRVRTMGRG